MLPSQSYSSRGQAKFVKQTFTSLVDSMLYLQRLRELEKKKEEAKEEAERRLIALETFKVDLSDDISKLSEVLGEAHTAELSKQISNFSSTAVELMKQKLSKEAQKQMETINSDFDSERNRAIKSIEAFLSVSPLPLIDRSIEVSLQEGAYAAKARYRCQDDIEYEFSLDTKVSSIFRSQLRLGTINKSLRIPVGMGKSWLKKEPVPDFQSLEQYVLNYAEATETGLDVEISEPEGEDTLKLHYSRHGDHASLSLSYSHAGGTLDITAEPALNAHLDSDSLMRLMERIWLAMNELEKRKISITKIIHENQSLLENLNFADFVTRSWLAISDSIKEALRPSGEKQLSSEEQIDRTFVKEKLKSLGAEGERVVELLDFPGFGKLN